MLNSLRQRMQAYLSGNTVGMLAVSGTEGISAVPVRYWSENLELDCLVPRWADAAYYVQQSPGVLFMVLSVFSSAKGGQLCWLQYRGKARAAATPARSDLLPEGLTEALASDMYLVVHLVPERIDLLDEREGWGARETLEIDDAHHW